MKVPCASSPRCVAVRSRCSRAAAASGTKIERRRRRRRADQIVADAEAAAKSATSVHVARHRISGSKPLALDLHLVAGKGGKGHLT